MIYCLTNVEDQSIVFILLYAHLSSIFQIEASLASNSVFPIHVTSSGLRVLTLLLFVSYAPFLTFCAFIILSPLSWTHANGSKLIFYCHILLLSILWLFWFSLTEFPILMLVFWLRLSVVQLHLIFISLICIFYLSFRQLLFFLLRLPFFTIHYWSELWWPNIFALFS